MRRWLNLKATAFLNNLFKRHTLAVYLCHVFLKVAEIDVQFCCGDDGTIGTIGDNVCCDGQLYSVDPPDINKTACCGSKPDPLPYDPNLDVCCNVRPSFIEHIFVYLKFIKFLFLYSWGS